MPTGVRRAIKRQRELSDLESRTRARVLAPQPERAPPTAEEILLAKFCTSRVFELIPRFFLQKARKTYLSVISAFSRSKPAYARELRARISDVAGFSSGEGKGYPEQYLAFLRVYCFPQAVLRLLYPGKEGVVDSQPETSALRARLNLFAQNSNEFLTLWWAGSDA